MRATGVDQAVQLVDAGGGAIPDALVPLPEGLWDAEQQRLTVTSHPGRIKQGVGPRRVQGPALVEGRGVRLQVGTELRSQRGVPIEPQSFEYVIGPEDRVPPDPATWRLVPPVARDAAVGLELDERLDPAILQRAVRLAESLEGEWVPRSVDLEVGDDGRHVRARPTTGTWRHGSYRIEVLSIVEDLAGNRPGRAFDADLQSGEPVGGKRRAPEWFTFRFDVPKALLSPIHADSPALPPN